MYVIRPITLEDLPSLLSLCTLTGFGLTTLPCDEKLLRRRIRDSMRGFEKLTDDDPPIGEAYLFVMEHTPTRQVCGTCAVVSKVGGFEPFYSYRIETSIHQSDVLKVRKEIKALHLVQDHDGPCEIGSLFLSPQHRAPGNGRLLSLSRFLFMANHPLYFDPIVIAEMRGVVDGKGHSPFWEAVGRHFFDVDFPKADYLSMVNKRFIADLMPTHPIYIPLLPKEAQAVIGEVHPDTRPALRILQDEGFTTTDQVDIFEAGPVVQCKLTDIRAFRESRQAGVVGISDQKTEGDINVVVNTSVNFRAALGTVAVDAGGATIQRDLAAALNVKKGDMIRFTTMKPSQRLAERYHDANMSFD
jgi:arginine N-succinyltransferase